MANSGSIFLKVVVAQQVVKPLPVHVEVSTASAHVCVCVCLCLLSFLTLRSFILNLVFSINSDNNRECDPDVCKCCAGCNDEGCANMDATMGRRVPLLVGKSSIDGAGLGLFTKNALKKGDYIDEYIGELIGIETEDTAYYFDLTKDFVMGTYEC
jgi:hypothetical protein